MARVDLEQGSQAWLDYRLQRIMATDASAIMGTNPFMNPMDVWEDKNLIRPPVVVNDSMKRGLQLEPEARKLACKLTNIKFDPCVYECDSRYWQAASLDGIDTENNYILEIKCPNENTHELALSGKMPDYYMTQMQHQFSVTGCMMGYYFSYRPEHLQKYAIISVYPDNEYIENLVDMEYEFYTKLCKMQPPTWTFKKR